MSVLTHDEILKRIKKEMIKIEPFSENQVGPASIDLHLGNAFRVFKRFDNTIRVTNEAPFPFEKYTEKKHLKEGEELFLMPGETVLGITRERIKLPPNICARLEGRSRFARMGLLVHISASFIQPGITNKQVLKLSNVGTVPLVLKPGIKICQMIFEETIGEAEYRGKFKEQTQP